MLCKFLHTQVRWIGINSIYFTFITLVKLDPANMCQMSSVFEAQLWASEAWGLWKYRRHWEPAYLCVLVLGWKTMWCITSGLLNRVFTCNYLILLRLNFQFLPRYWIDLIFGFCLTFYIFLVFKWHFILPLWLDYWSFYRKQFLLNPWKFSILSNVRRWNLIEYVENFNFKAA